MSTRRPNVVFIMTDQQKATAIDLYGGPVKTPNLARIVAEGILYEQCYTPHPLCVPARVSFWTGRWPHSHGARTNEIPMPRSETHLAQLLHGAGYALGHFGKNHCFVEEDFERYFSETYFVGHGDRGGPGATMVRSQVQARSPQAGTPGISDHWGFRRPVARMKPEPREESATYQITENACRFLETQHAAEPDRPVCVWVSIPDPHEPYQVPEPYAALYPPDEIELPPWKEGEFAEDSKPERQRVYRHFLNWDELSENDARLAMSIYFGMVAFIDERVGHVLDTLERLGMREDTIVVFCSDHGDYMGEHHMLIKSNAFYDCLTRVPLLVSYPRGVAARGERRSEFVSLIDVMPTVLSLAGLSEITPAAVQGQALPGVPGSPPARPAAYSEYGCGGPAISMGDAQRLFPRGSLRPLHPLLREREAQGHGKMARTERWKYTYDVLDESDEELYDLAQDPWELNNLARSEQAEHVAARAEMRRLLAEWMLRTENTRPVPLYFEPFWEGTPPREVALGQDGGPLLAR